ncbi:MAG: hypothetical protein LBI33_01975 [Propionibacteriaceae bacterium]|jgi:hypothetical protein|nr:hypothetical protein [Propionibacteriaceae bacterium]
MSTTATIRVPTRTRDQLARLAEQTGVSLSGYLSDLAQRERRAAILAAARQEALDFETNPAAQAEFALWEEAPADGID